MSQSRVSALPVPVSPQVAILVAQMRHQSAVLQQELLHGGLFALASAGQKSVLRLSALLLDTWADRVEDLARQPSARETQGALAALLRAQEAESRRDAA